METCVLDVEKFVDKIRELAPRPFGTVGELIVDHYTEELSASNNISYDRISSNNEKVEVKFSRAYVKSTPLDENNLLESIVRSPTKKDSHVRDLYKFELKWDCNIQQVKPDCFEILYYGIFFRDQVYIFKIRSEQIISDTAIGYSDKQHRGNSGEGQFHIKNTNLQHHLDNYLYTNFDYEDLINSIKETQNT